MLLLFGQFLLFSLDIRAAGRFAQGRVEVLHVVGLELLHLHAADIGDNQVLDGGKVGFVGLGCPLVFAALLTPFSLHGVPAPFRRRFPALPLRIIAGYLMQTVILFSRFKWCLAGSLSHFQKNF